MGVMGPPSAHFRAGTFVQSAPIWIRKTDCHPPSAPFNGTADLPYKIPTPAQY